MAPAEELGAEQGQAQSQDDLTKDAQGDLSLEAEPPTPDQFEAPPVAQPSELSPAATPTPTPGQPPAAEPGAGGRPSPPAATGLMALKTYCAASAASGRFTKNARQPRA